MTYEEKLYIIVKAIEEIKKDTPPDYSLNIPFKKDLLDRLGHQWIDYIFQKLERENVIKIIGTAIGDNYLSVSITLSEDFDKWYQGYLKKTKSENFREENILEQPKKAEITPKESVYEIIFTPSREILINNSFKLTKPNFDSENDLVFQFLYEHPNQKHSQMEIEKAINRNITKSLHKIVENLGFKGELKKFFMDVTKSSICFRNPITRDDLDKLGVAHIRLPK